MKKVLSFIVSALLTYFLYYKVKTTYTILGLIFIGLFFLINYSLKNKGNKKISIILSIILTIIYVICDSIEKDFAINIINNYLPVNIIMYFTLFYFLVKGLFCYLDNYKNKKQDEIKLINKEILTSSKFSFIFSFVLFFVVELLLLLKFYPGILTYDSFNELMQTKGIIPLMNNHSILHTGILFIFVKIGSLFKSVNIGIFLYMIFQVSIVSIVFSYILHFLSKKNAPLVLRLITLLILLFHPISIVYSISLWKDIFFSLVFILFSINLYYYTTDEKYFNTKKNIIYFGLISLLLMYLRNNGVYVVIISLLIIGLMNLKNKKALLVFLTIVLTFFLSKTIIFKTLNIKDYEVREMLSTPSQAIARIYKNGNITKKEKEQIEKFYSDKIGELYIPTISDNTKGLLNEEYYNKHKKEYIKLNMNLFIKHNKEYIESFVSNNYGYYYVNSYYSSINLQKTDEVGVIHKELVDDKILLIVYGIVAIFLSYIILYHYNNKLLLLLGLIPISFIGMSLKDNRMVMLLFNTGFYSSIMLISFIYNKKNKRNISYFIPSLILWLSLLFSPVYAEFRYIYPIFLMTPIFICLTLNKEKRV